MLGVDTGELAGEVGEDVMLALENDPAWSVGACDEALAGFEPGGSEFGDRDGDLMLGADRRRPGAVPLHLLIEVKVTRSGAVRNDEAQPLDDAVELWLPLSNGRIRPK